jgi:hypothetical protein
MKRILVLLVVFGVALGLLYFVLDNSIVSAKTTNYAACYEITSVVWDGDAGELPQRFDLLPPAPGEDYGHVRLADTTKFYPPAMSTWKPAWPSSARVTFSNGLGGQVLRFHRTGDHFVGKSSAWCDARCDYRNDARVTLRSMPCPATPTQQHGPFLIPSP